MDKELRTRLLAIGLGSLQFLIGYFLMDLRDRAAFAEAEVRRVELLLVSKYPTTETLDKMQAAIFVKLDRIEAKLDGKADKR